ncbi:MAG: hypothetical protein WAV05_09720 [Anaerolineales bacterium]
MGNKLLFSKRLKKASEKLTDAFFIIFPEGIPRPRLIALSGLAILILISFVLIILRR